MNARRNRPNGSKTRSSNLSSTALMRCSPVAAASGLQSCVDKGREAPRCGPRCWTFKSIFNMRRKTANDHMHNEDRSVLLFLLLEKEKIESFVGTREEGERYEGGNINKRETAGA